MEILKRGSRGPAVKELQHRLHLIEDSIFGPLTEEGVKTFQRDNGLTVDGIAGPKTLSALGLTQREPKRNVTRIILHYTATPEDEDFTVEQIRASHKARGFTDIGYHYVIYRDGTIHKGRDESKSGAHTSGYNATSIGVCYVGGCPTRKTRNWQYIGKDTRTPAQKASLLKLLKELKQRYPGASVHGHNEFAAKPCPGFNAKSEYKNI